MMQRYLALDAQATMIDVQYTPTWFYDVVLMRRLIFDADFRSLITIAFMRRDDRWRARV